MKRGSNEDLWSRPRVLEGPRPGAFGGFLFGCARAGRRREARRAAVLHTRQPSRFRENSPGLFHVAFKVGDSLDELRAAKADLDAAGVAIEMTMDHTVTQRIYVRDPDGNAVELYVDSSDPWKTDPQLVATGGPLEL